MIISYKVLTKILLKLKHRYVPEPFNAPEFNGRCIIKLMVANEYPIGPFNYFPDTKEEMTAMTHDRVTNVNGKVMIHYDMDNDRILSCCSLLYAAIREERFNIIQKINKQHEQGGKNVFSRNQIPAQEKEVPCSST